jgi:hypothetical protein
MEVKVDQTHSLDRIQVKWEANECSCKETDCMRTNQLIQDCTPNQLQ